jgi:hypothetical protein
MTAPAGAREQEPEPLPIRVAMDWKDLTDPVCVTQAQLETSVDGLLSRTAFGSEPADAIVRGRMTSNEDGTRTARIELFRPDGTSLGARELRSAEKGCRTLIEGIPIALALMIDTRRKEVRLKLPEPREPTPIVPTQPLPNLRVVVEPPDRWHGEMEAVGAIERGLFPGTTFASRFGVGWIHTSGWGVRAQGGVVAPHTERYEAGSVTLWAWQIGGGSSWRVLDTTSLRADLGVALETGEMLSRGSGFDYQKTARSWLFEGLAGGRGLLDMGGGWALGAGGWCGVPVASQRVTYRESGVVKELSRSSPVFVRGEVLLGLRAF